MHAATAKKLARELGFTLTKTDDGWIADDGEDRITMTYESAEEALEAVRELVTLANEEADETEDEPVRKGVVPERYRARYKEAGDPTGCGDAVHAAFREATTVDGKLSLNALREVAEANGLSAKLDEYEEKGLNNGMRRMNIGNMLRARAKKGEAVVIGETRWEAAPAETA